MTTPYYADDLVTLHHGDCREIDAWLAADVLVTDPPYGRAWAAHNFKAVGARAHAGILNDHSTEARDNVLAAWGSPRPAIVFGDLMFAPAPGTKQVLVYRKQSNAGLRGALGGYRRDTEAIYIIGKWSSGWGGDTSVLTTTSRDAADGSRRYGHPHTKPLDLMQQLITRTEGVIADPFAGAGSTLVAARSLGRPAIGVELDEAYCEMAARRLSQGAFDFGDWDGAA